MTMTKSKLVVAMALTLLTVSCGKVKDGIDEIANDRRIQGHWLLSQSEHAGVIERALEKESVVLTFQDGKAAFSPTDSVKGTAVYKTLSACSQGPRPFTTDKQQLVFLANGICPEKRVTIQQLDANTLKFPDPDNNDITRVLGKISEDQYKALVKASDRKP